MDDIDYNTLKALQNHPRYNERRIARRLGISEASIRRRIARLIYEGIVRIVAVTSPWKVGFSSTVLMGIEVEISKLVHVMDALAAFPMVHWLGLTSGRFNILIWATFRSSGELAQFIKRDVALIPGIHRLETMYASEFKKRDLRILLDDHESPIQDENQANLTENAQPAKSNSHPVKIDEQDRRIIKELEEDARQSNAHISRKLKISESTVRRRIQRLMKEDVFKIAAIIDPFKVGYTTVAFIGIQVEVSRLNSIWPKLIAIPRLHVLFLTIGRMEIFAWVTFRSPQELTDFIERDLYAVPGILGTETFINLEIKKRDYTVI